jgi:hypothetical protein
MSNSVKTRAVELLATVKEYDSGYRSHADTETHVRPLTKLENELIDALKALVAEPLDEQLWEYRAAEIADDRIDTWGPKGNPDVSWATLAEAEAGAALDGAFVVKRRRSGPWERVRPSV